MTFFHMDAVTAAAAETQTVGWDWTDSAPFGEIVADAGGNGFFGSASLTIYGEGEANIGRYITIEDGFENINKFWIDPTKTSQVPNYFLRLTDLQTQDGPSFPGSLYTYSGVWTNGRTEWRSLASVSPHSGVISDTDYRIAATAAGEFGDPFYEENLWGDIELGTLSGPTETFEAANVDIGNDEIVLVGHAFETGDEVLYLTGGGGAPTPLVDNTVYTVRKVSVDRISLGVTLGDIDATPNFINLTFAGTGTNHSFQRLEPIAVAPVTVTASI